MNFKIIHETKYLFSDDVFLEPHFLRFRPKQTPFNGGVKYDWIVWIDSDIVWKAEQLTELLNTPANQQSYHQCRK